MSYFSRDDICDASYVYATRYHGGQGSKEYALLGRLSKLGYSPGYSVRDGHLENLDENAIDILIDMVRAKHGDDRAEDVRRECRPEKADITFRLENSDDDPTTINLHAYYDHAKVWADWDQTIDGSSWECDGSDFIYNILYWRPGLIDELKAEGYSLDQSVYCEPTEEEAREYWAKQEAEEA
jgi:hypothetical protein